MKVVPRRSSRQENLRGLQWLILRLRRLATRTRGWGGAIYESPPSELKARTGDSVPPAPLGPVAPVTMALLLAGEAVKWLDGLIELLPKPRLESQSSPTLRNVGLERLGTFRNGPPAAFLESQTGRVRLAGRFYSPKQAGCQVGFDGDVTLALELSMPLECFRLAG